MFESSIVTRTNQKWKLVVSAGAVLAGGGVILWGATVFDARPENAVLKIIGGLLIVVAGATFGSTCVYCPRCGARWVWQAISSRESANWLAWLFSLEFCPSCGFFPCADR